MARAYSPKKIEIIFEQVETTSEVVERKISEAYAILFEETMKYLKEKKGTKKMTSVVSQQLMEGGQNYDQR